MTTSPLLPITAETLAACFAATELESARSNRDAFRDSLAFADNDLDYLADICLDDCRDNLFEYASFFFTPDQLASMTDAESDAIDDQLAALIAFDAPSLNLIHSAIANAYRHATAL